MTPDAGAAILGVETAQSLFWISTGALVVPLVSRRLRVPSAVGELIYGIALGPYALRLFAPDDFIDIMAHLGFAILMFSAGMEIDFAPLRKRGSRLLSSAWIWVLMTLLAAAAAMGYLALGPWLALASGCVSIGLAVAVLREREMLGSPLGQVILTVGLIGETISIVLLTAFDFFFRLGGFKPEFFTALTRFAVIFGLAYVLMRMLRFLIWWYPRKVGAFVESDDPLELGVRLAVAMLFIFVAAAVMLGVESILGAFIAGALFSFIFQEREAITEKINALGQGFFIPFFFIVVGSRFRPPGSLADLDWLLLGKLLLFAWVIKAVPFLLFTRLKLDPRSLIAGGMMLSMPLTLTIAVAEVGYRLHEFDPQARGISRKEQGMLILFAIVTGLVFPFLSRMLLSPSRKPKTEQDPL